MKRYTIKQGEHNAGYRFHPHYGKMKDSKVITFFDSAIYNLESVDQYDINKLYGISYGMHHSNSARFGWRSLQPYSSEIEILAYCYVDGERIRERDVNLTVCTVSTNKPYYYKLTTDDAHYQFDVYNGEGELQGSKQIEHGKLPKWGYHLFPYFGGNCTAPHDITIQFG